MLDLTQPRNPISGEQRLTLADGVARAFRLDLNALILAQEAARKLGREPVGFESTRLLLWAGTVASAGDAPWTPEIVGGLIPAAYAGQAAALVAEALKDGVGETVAPASAAPEAEKPRRGAGKKRSASPSGSPAGSRSGSGG